MKTKYLLMLLVVLLSAHVTKIAIADWAWDSSITQLSLSGQNADSPAIASDSHGNITAVWRRTNGSKWVIESARNVNNKWLAFKSNISSSTGDAYSPVVSDGGGDIVRIAWMSDGPYDGKGVNSSHYSKSSSGSNWIHDGEVGVGELLEGTSPLSLAVNGSGNSLVIWRRNTNPGIQGSYSFNGYEWWAPPLPLTYDKQTSNPGVIINDFDEGVATWGDAGYIKGSVFSLNWGGVKVISSGYNPVIVGDGGGNAIVAWTSKNSGNFSVIQSIGYNKYTSGGLWGSVTTLSPPGLSSSSVSLAANVSGQVVAVWIADDNGQSTIQAARQNFGGSWSPPFNVSLPNLGDDDTQPNAAVDTKGNIIVVWTHRNASGVTSIQTRYYSSDENAWTKIGMIPTSSGYDYAPKVVMDDNGNASLIWIRYGVDPSVIMSIRGHESTAPMFNISIAKTGAGTITSTPAGISCGNTCAASFTQGTEVTLTASPDTGQIFTGWSGACSGKGACVVKMNNHKSVTANFNQIQEKTYILRVAKSLNGTITSFPDGINCGTLNKLCKAKFSNVTLIASPKTGYIFKKWNGCPAPQGDTCFLSLTKNATVGAAFSKIKKVN